MPLSRIEIHTVANNAVSALERGDINQTIHLLDRIRKGTDPEELSLIQARSRTGRPNKDKRVLIALRDLGGERRCVPASELAEFLGMSKEVHAATAVARARARGAPIYHVGRAGYTLTHPADLPDRRIISARMT